MTTTEEILKRVIDLEKNLYTQNLLQKNLLLLKEASDLTGVSKSTIYKWIASRKLSHYKASGKLVFLKREELYDFITRNKYSSKEELVCSALSNADKSKKIINESN
jgi:excisionase family DNA binding protein